MLVNLLFVRRVRHQDCDFVLRFVTNIKISPVLITSILYLRVYYRRVHQVCHALLVLFGEFLVDIVLL